MGITIQFHMGIVYIIYIYKDRLRPGGVLVNGNLSSVLLVFSVGFGAT